MTHMAVSACHAWMDSFCASHLIHDASYFAHWDAWYSPQRVPLALFLVTELTRSCVHLQGRCVTLKAILLVAASRSNFSASDRGSMSVSGAKGRWVLCSVEAAV